MDRQTDLDTIQRRLIARHAHLDRQLDAALAELHLPREAFDRAVARAAEQADPRALEEARAAVEARAEARGRSWQETTRPSLDDVIRERRPLVRA